MGKEHLHFTSLTSTNDYLKQLTSERELAEGFTVTTEYQTSGRGQVGNTWESEKGENLLMSVLLKPQSLLADHFFYLNMSVCLAITDCLSFFHPGFCVKWPNDILFARKKVGGVLIENSITRQHLKQAIIGVGVNVNQREFKSFPIATSLSQITGQPVDLSFLLERLLKNLEQRYQQLFEDKAALKKEYFQNLYGYHQPVPVEIAGHPTRAEIKDVLPDGTLQALIDGQVQSFQFKGIKFVL